MATVQVLSHSKFYQQDFSGQNLHAADLSHSVFHNCCFDDADLSEATCEFSDFIGSSFNRTNCRFTSFKRSSLAATVFKPSDAYGVTLTMDCKTFENMSISQLWFYSLLVMISTMLPDAFPVKEDLTGRLMALIGAERYAKLRAMLQRREI